MRLVRVLHCPLNVGGVPGALARAEREVGLDSRSVAFFSPPGEHIADELLRRPEDGKLAFEVRRWRLLVRALRDFDVVHFNFGRTILPPPTTWDSPRPLARLGGRLLGLRDLPLLRRAGKGIVVTFQGDDARQGDVLRRRYKLSIASQNPEYYRPAGDAAKRRIIAAFDHYAHRLYYLNPDLGHVLPPRAEFLPYACLDLRDWRPRAATSGPLLVVHAPSDRDVKGTRYVLEAVEQLHEAGVEFDFRLVEGLSRAAARVIYERADLGVDQLLAGWYGSFGVELMALGKPVICFIRDEDLGFIPAEMRQELPITQSTPENIFEVLRRSLAQSADERVATGRRCRRFVERWHDPREIAHRLKRVYEEIAV